VRRPSLIQGSDGRKRCAWSGTDPIYVHYHDKEWGVPVKNDRKLFEFLILEGAQAGLSWITILKRRAGYRKAFANFDPKKVARFGPREVRVLIKDPGIIRNRLKVHAAVTNAKAFLEVQKEFGSFSKYAWGFVGGKTIHRRPKSMREIPPTSKDSDAWSKDMKKRGFKFVGSTILYAHMQATGMVNDHLLGCFRKTLIKRGEKA
jgi:DNA-3-methyladenine glycosylase I